MSKQRFGGLKYGQCPDGPRGKPKKMADGGKVEKYADGGETKKKVSKKTPKKDRRPTPETLGTGMAAEAGRRILSARERREREAGL